MPFPTEGDLTAARKHIVISAGDRRATEGGEMRSVDSTAALSDNSFLRAVDATAVTKSNRFTSAVCATSAGWRHDLRAEKGWVLGSVKNTDGLTST